ncbi:MAG: glycoside hydrolase family 3 N-terminal domain-containing protein, partial [Rhodothermales bacterium]
MRLEDLSLEEKAAQLIFARLGSNMPPPVRVSEDIDRFSALLDDVPLGGLIIFNGSYPETPRALEVLQKRSKTPLLVTADMERGVGQQIRGATVFPHAMAFSAAGKEMLARAARVQAREALACGVHVTFSPVADVNRDPRNPIIATRAFGTDPEESAALVRTFIRGCRTEGLLTTAKHFPGHGNTSRDSHEEMPVVESSRNELTEYDLLPFAAAVDEGVDLIMTAHVLFPALDPNHPATLSEKILRGLLREEMGYTGAVVTDSLLMGAISRSHADPGLQAAALVKAGVDILLDVPDPGAAWKGIVHAVEEGSLEPGLVDEAAGRVLALKQRLAARFGPDVFTTFP